MELIYYPSPILYQKCNHVENIDSNIKDVISEMFKIMYEQHGIGLAAPQVGLLLRFFITNVSGNPEDKSSERVYINPEIISTSGREVSSEGCLSFPNIFPEIVRFSKIVFKSKTLDGDEIKGELEGLAARVFQHELDHLNGILIVKRMSRADKIKFKRELASLEEKYLENLIYIKEIK